MVATNQMIKGVGGYKETEDVAYTFSRTMPDNVYQIHGHRNVKSLPIQNDRVFNLEGHVEFGGCLRCVQVRHDGIHAFEIKNDVFKSPDEINQDKAITHSSVADDILILRSNEYIKEKKYGNISSFNFNSQAFYNKAWDEQTIKARGLYIDTDKCRVVARGYSKFFNINERPETKFDMLKYKLRFPVTAYVKENGFLGIVSYNEYTDDLFITTKSNPEGDYAKWLKDMLYKKVSKENLDMMKEYIKEHNVSFVFECVDMEHDPHIIEYPESKLYLLDIIYNDMEFKKYDFNTLCYLSNKFGLIHKEKAYEISTWQEFFDWYQEILDNDYEYKGQKIEGFVIEDSVGYMTKVKLYYYNFWKFMRSIAYESIRKGCISPQRTSALTTPLANEFYYWVKNLHNDNDFENIPKDICTLRKAFYESRNK